MYLLIVDCITAQNHSVIINDADKIKQDNFYYKVLTKGAHTHTKCIHYR